MQLFSSRFAIPALLLLTSVTGACTDDDPAQHAITAKLAFTRDADGQHVTFGTQNGSTVSLLASELVGKTVYWATTAGGEPVTNAPTIDVAATPVDADLRATFVTPAHYDAGPWEVSAVVALTGSAPPNLPVAGDLAAFDNTTPPAGEPPVTGVSVRVRIVDADTELTMTNATFIRFGNQ
ncbi:MAG: hypothetical protein R3B48_16060 [Kofleriaceae bacterium]